MRRSGWTWLGMLAALALAALPAWAAGDDVLAHGVRDGDAPAWAVAVASPAGWTRDCCTYARAIGVAAVLYQGEWTGNPERVMVLNVWPRKLATLDVELAADRASYLKRDAKGKVTAIRVSNRHMPCRGVLYEGSDQVDDVVVFCDPGAASGVRLSWSLSFAANDAAKRALLDDFMRVAVNARYEPYVAPKAAAKS